MTDALTIRPARRDEASLLTGLTLRSKAHWGYDDEFMRRVAGDLTVRPDQLDGAAVAERDGHVLGYYLLEESRDGGRTALLDSLFIDPDAMGGGVGRALVTHALALAARRGIREVVLDSDPFAEPFYAHLGARRVGESPSGSVPGRSLPRMAFTVPAGADVGAAG